MSRPPFQCAAVSWLVLVIFIALQVLSCSSPEERAQSYYESGVRLLAANDNEKAAVEFLNAVRLNKNLLPAWRGLAKAEEAAQHWERLVPALRMILQIDPKDDAARIKLARIFLAGGAIDQALKLLNDANRPEIQNAELLGLKAIILYKLKDNDAAIRAARAALSIASDNVEALSVIAADRLASNDPKAALQLLSTGSDAEKTNLGVQLIKLKIYEQLNDLPQVETLLRNLTQLYPDQVEFRKKLIQFYIGHHRQDDAENELRLIAGTDPKNAEIELELIRFLYETKGSQAARAEIVARISAGADVFPFKMALADLDYTGGRINESRDLLKTLAGDAGSPEHALLAKMKLAELDINSKDFDNAERLVSDLLSDGSLSALKLHAGVLRLRALIRLNRGQVEEAIFDLREALETQPRSAELKVLLATAYERSGAIELAEKQFADALRVSTFDPGVGLGYASFLGRHGETERAEDILTDLVRRQPENVAILSALAEVKLTRQDWAGAQDIAETIRRTHQSDVTADQILGQALSGQQKDEESIAAYESATAAAPSAVQPIEALVRAFVRAKEPDRAVSFLQSVLKSDPANSEAYVLLGSVQLAKNAPDEAMKDFMTAIEKQPRDSVGYRAVADLYLRQKNTDAAQLVVRAGLKQQPDSVALHVTLAGILEQIGHYDAAISEYEWVLSQQPGSMIAANNLASLLADHRTDKASLERAQSLAARLRQSPVPQFKDTLGWVSYRTGHFRTAVPPLEEAAAALPDQAIVHYHLGMTYAALGQAAKASIELNLALTKVPSPELGQIITAELNKIRTQ